MNDGDDNNKNYEWKLINYDFVSLYPETQRMFDDDFLERMQREKKIRQRKEKLERLLEE